MLYLVIALLLGVAIWQLDRALGVSSTLETLLKTMTASVADANLPRGTIYDRNLKQAALTMDRVSVYARTQELKSIPTTVQSLGEILSLDEKELHQQLESGQLRVWLAEDISLEQELAIKSKRLPGVYLQKEEKRFYPNGSQAAHLLGYAEKGIGLAGVEQYYDRLLASRKRQEEAKLQLNSSQDLVLTLDLKIQDILDKLLEDIARQGGVRRVLAYIMEAPTGAIVGGAQFPGFDPNNFARYSPEVLGNRLFVPLVLPERFRSLLRDAALLHAEEPTKLPWSVREIENNLGGQLRLWDWLGLNEKPVADFHILGQSGRLADQDQKSASPRSPLLQMVPERATPFHILTAYTAMQNEGRRVQPFIVQRHRGEQTQLDVPLLEGEGKGRGEGVDGINLHDSGNLLRSHATHGTAKSYYIHDEILVSSIKGSDQHLSVNELLFAAIPAGGSDLNLLMVVERDPSGSHPRNGKKTMTLEQLVDEKVERISILQQVAKTVADVVEPELSEDGNYQGVEPHAAESRKSSEVGRVAAVSLPVMPDLRGESLRKSLRILQGVYLKISIRGTGRVVAQKPAPGTPMKDMEECSLILLNVDDIVPEKLSRKIVEEKR